MPPGPSPGETAGRTGGPARQGSSPMWRRGVLPAALIVAAGVTAAFLLRWHCDDAFITFRYVENFLAGKGLVYNEGEFVEGYTHFLWLLLLVCCARAGLDPASASLGLGVASYAGVLALFCLASYRIARGRAVLFVPFTAAALVVNRDFRIWATGGLETMFFTFLLSAAFFVYFFTGLSSRTRSLLSGALLALSTLARPDGALLFAFADACLLARALPGGAGRRGRLADVAAFNAPLLPLLGPYLVWKYSYYGGILPNTYYAKSAGEAYFSQGFYYLWLYFKAHFTSWLALLAACAAVAELRRRRRGGGGARARATEGGVRDPVVSSAVFALLGSVAYLVLFVARVGGDFMYARFVVPVVPFLMFSVEGAVVALSGKGRVVAPIAYVAVVAAIAFVENPERDRLLQKTEDGRPAFVSHKGIIDEHYLRTVVDDIERDKAFGLFLRPYFEGLDATVLLKGRACLGYYAGFKTCIENFGLTDEYIAHLPVDERSRPGHEKEAPHDYLVKRGVDFAFDGKTMFFERARPYEFAWFDSPDGRRVRAQMFTYDRGLVEALAERMGDRFEYTDFVKYLDEYISKDLHRVGSLTLLRDYMLFRDFYFMHNRDTVRENLFLQKLGKLTAPRPRLSPRANRR